MESLINNKNKTNDNLANQLNQECYCRTLDRKALNNSLQDQLVNTRDNPLGANELNKLFSATPVFVPKTEIEAMVRIIAAIESTARLPSYQQQVLSWAPNIAAFDPGPIGAFMGYDFHLGSDDPKLIEINTNAGGAFLNVALARAQKHCCRPSEQSVATTKMLDGFEEAVANMFIQEWQRQSATSMPNRIAIVDIEPKSQFMYLEFQLACQLLQAKGIDTVILDPSELNYADGVLTAHSKPIDMIYNRLVDFAFENPNHAVLKSAYLEGAVVVTPNPHAHAIFANKRNLTLLSDTQTLQSWGLGDDDAEYLKKSVPTTRMVTKEDAAELWRTRRQLFFKPVAGYGSKGVYRGSKITRRVFETILDESYIAQTFIPATERSIKIDDVVTTRKVDIRLYTYAGQLLLTAGRIYQGQATNFRTPGGGFAPVFQTHLTDDLERKIIALFALGNSYQDIRMHIEDMYGIELSNGTLNAVTDKLIPELQAWRERDLDAIYPIVWLDAIHYKIKENGRFVSKAVYTILGLNVEGKKELLGLYLSDAEGAHHWLSVLTDLHNRGVKDILIACVDGLKGFPEAIQSIYPQTEIQHCIIHQIRNSIKYVASKNQKAFMADLKCVYKAATLNAAETALDELEVKWGEKYPVVIKSWRTKWETLSAYFKYPDYIRTAIYTTNAVEAVHRQFRKLTKTKGGFPNENSLLKLLYAGILKASERWTHPVQNWNLTLSQLSIHFEGRLDAHIDL